MDETLHPVVNVERSRTSMAVERLTMPTRIRYEIRELGLSGQTYLPCKTRDSPFFTRERRDYVFPAANLRDDRHCMRPHRPVWLRVFYVETP